MSKGKSARFAMRSSDHLFADSERPAEWPVEPCSMPRCFGFRRGANFLAHSICLPHPLPGRWRAVVPLAFAALRQQGSADRSSLRPEDLPVPDEDHRARFRRRSGHASGPLQRQWPRVRERQHIKPVGQCRHLNESDHQNVSAERLDVSVSSATTAVSSGPLITSTDTRIMKSVIPPATLAYAPGNQSQKTSVETTIATSKQAAACSSGARTRRRPSKEWIMARAPTQG